MKFKLKDDDRTHLEHRQDSTTVGLPLLPCPRVPLRQPDTLVPNQGLTVCKTVSTNSCPLEAAGPAQMTLDPATRAPVPKVGPRTWLTSVRFEAA